MKKEIDRANYRKKTSRTTSTIAGIISIICLVVVILWKPAPGFHYEPADMVVSKDAPVYVYDHFGSENRWQLKETDRIIPEGTHLKAVAEASTYKWAVEDGSGSRFAVDKSKLDGDVSKLKAITPGYCHVYRGMSLNGRRLDDICKEAGDYIYADADSGKYYFRQIVLADGKNRYEGVLLTVDGDGIVTDTEPVSPAHKNLYTYLPFFDRIISLNIFNKFIPFTTDADTEVLESFSLKKIGAKLWEIVVTIVKFFAILLGAFFVVFLAIGVAFGAGNLVFNSIGRLTRMKNGVILAMEYVYMIPCTYIILLSALFIFNDIWILVLPFVIGLLVWMFSLIENFSVRDARCPKCLSLNTLDVEKITYLTGYDVECKEGKSMKVGTEEPIDVARVIEHRVIETHTECCNCHHTNDTSRKQDHKCAWAKIESIPCPKCGKHTLRGCSTVMESTAKYVTETYTHTGKIKDKGYSLKTGDRVFESNDRSTTYGHWEGYVLYDKDIYCTECDYDNTVEYKYYPDTTEEKIHQENFKTRWKPKDGFWG